MYLMGCSGFSREQFFHQPGEERFLTVLYPQVVGLVTFAGHLCRIARRFLFLLRKGNPRNQPPFEQNGGKPFVR